MATPRPASDTPLMRQWVEVKERHPDCLIFFRVGDFYELFYEDAQAAARAIDLTLTTRDKGKEDAVPMAGVPHHAARQYLARLVEQGFKVAICDQVEDPKLAKGLVKREVTRVVTPGVLIDEEQLDARSGWYLAAVVPGVGEGEAGFAWLDVSTGEFAATELGAAALSDELARVAPRELLLPAGALPILRSRLRIPISELPASPEGEKADLALLAEALGTTAADLGLSSWPRATAAAAACVRYARSTQPAGTLPLTRLVTYRPAEHLVLDESTQAHLELFETLAERKRRGSLLSILDETKTAPGARLLRRFLGAPLTDVAAIRRRHDAVEWLVHHATLRALLRTELAEVYDVERLAGRVTLGVATPRDLVSLRRSLERLPGIHASLADAAGHDLAPPELLRLGLGGLPSDAVRMDLCADVALDIGAALVDDPPAQWKEGGIIRRGHHAELDELCDIATGGKDAILAIEARERDRTGIASLKVRFNRVFGYYIEITRSNLARVPEGYQRKQTLANAERYTTPELAEYERKVLGAEERRLTLEEQLFTALRSRVAKDARRIQALAEQVALLDTLASLAEVAHAGGYVRPEIEASGRLEIDDGRHPVVERMVSGSGGFVPNDVRLYGDRPDEPQLLVITGPNMAGKSTLMRQVALITLMAQAGSFVPARAARIGVVDRIFTRVGASDNLSRGESTFMLEMRETASILRHATRRSLIILDEIGRGTSTYDGLSIAWAVAEYLHDRVGGKTLFATHYHELTALARSRPRVRNMHVAVREWKDEVVFLHKLVEGGANRSYGIQVARLAGVPRPVLDRAREVLAALERGEEGTRRGGVPSIATSPQLGLFGGEPAREEAPRSNESPSRKSEMGEAATVVPVGPFEIETAEVIARLRGTDPDELSPRQAHALLCELRVRLLAKAVGGQALVEGQERKESQARS